MYLLAEEETFSFIIVSYIPFERTAPTEEMNRKDVLMKSESSSSPFFILGRVRLEREMTKARKREKSPETCVSLELFTRTRKSDINFLGGDPRKKLYGVSRDFFSLLSRMHLRALDAFYNIFR